MKLAGAAGVALAVPRVFGAGFGFAKKHNDDAMLGDLSERFFRYFEAAIDPETGICMDLIHGNHADSAKKMDDSRGSTLASLALYTDSDVHQVQDHKWITREKAKRPRPPHASQLHQWQSVRAERIRFYHFNDVHTGARWKEVEIST